MADESIIKQIFNSICNLVNPAPFSVVGKFKSDHYIDINQKHPITFYFLENKNGQRKIKTTAPIHLKTTVKDTTFYRETCRSWLLNEDTVFLNNTKIEQSPNVYEALGYSLVDKIGDIDIHEDEDEDKDKVLLSSVSFYENEKGNRRVSVLTDDDFSYLPNIDKKISEWLNYKTTANITEDIKKLKKTNSSNVIPIKLSPQLS
ncbi:MAG: hypothetical protein KAJ86_04025 [Alphaproteobacteria bacterium]|nr:hypothetical protein [Alphaproteobacteria bacterium]